jgi:ribosomal protein L40E
MVFAVDAARCIAVGIAAALLLILVLAFLRYTREGHGRGGANDELRRAAVRAGKDTKVCPDCASDVSLDAGVCRHCGYRFA